MICAARLSALSLLLDAKKQLDVYQQSSDFHFSQISFFTSTKVL